MQLGSFNPARKLGLLALVALLGLAVTFTATSASGAGFGHAVAAKKKCKKKGKKSAAAAKKKKCKHKKATPPVTPPRGPVERIKISWTGNADLDVHAWSNGLHDGWNQTLDNYEVQIPGTTYDNSQEGGDNETIVETNPNPSVPMTFGICNYPFEGADSANVSVTWVLADGTTKSDQFELDFDDFRVELDPQAGPADPVDEWCPEPI